MAMDSSTPSPYHSSHTCHILHMFNRSSGKLQRHLCRGEYTLLKDMPVFESDFIQINRKGEVIDMHNNVQMVTVGIAYTTPSLTMPDVMLLAQPAVSCAANARNSQDTQIKDLKSTKSLELTRLLPLKFVKLSIYNHEKKQFHLKLATGRSFYLQLYLPSDAKEDLFACWEDLVYLLRPPLEAYSGTQAQPAGDMISLPVLEAEDRKSPAAMELRGQGDQDQDSIKSLPTVTNVSGVTSHAYSGGEGIRQLASHTYSVCRNTLSLLIPSAGSSHRAAVAPQGSSEGNVSKQDGDHRVSQVRDEVLRKSKEKESTPAKRPSHPGGMEEDESSLKSHRTTQGGKTEDESNLKGQGHGSSFQELVSFSFIQKGSRLSQKLRKSLSRTWSGG
ncbi:Golgi-associated RAB2 interactor protein 6-like isoform X2 [Canis lupus baileyi]|uniref:Golgi associated RAB2 interactor protein 6-like isoform X2 n=1 Tax=Canis lupus dingo TaxID=286419 RepID=UPI000DC66489|nr:Golgi associated RAB2 interactor protein 6-like isoform X2 [Canis lupus dingo]XP_038301697.1 protein FAM71C-like isoform X2 [Canis lupus familiaris]XP_038412385.1 protein FAM71C-like isoform X2 [Canis lupus familiaris]XP_038542003.1 protein FAM71C-like isoform X2 [Canis lupus familiaris]